MVSDYIKKLSKKSMGFAAFILIAILALYNWSLTPFTKYLQAAQKYENTAREIKKTGKIIDAQLQSSQKKLDEISERSGEKEQEFFSISDAKSFLETIASNARKFQCAADNLRFLPHKQIIDDNSLDVRCYQVQFNVVGQYPSIVRLLDSLQRRKEKVWIDTINISLKDIQTGLLDCDLSLSIYTLKKKEIKSYVDDSR